MKRINYLCYLVVVLTLISAGFGFFYSTGSGSYTVESTYGEKVELYGDGIYKYDTYFKAGLNKGTDFAMIIVAGFFALFTEKGKKAAKYRFLQAGLLLGLLYYSSCLVFGVMFNTLFPVYVLLFSSTFFTMILLLSELIKENNISKELNSKSLKGTAVFIIVSGSSVLVWLSFIIPALITGQPLAHTEIYTTEPTYILDLGIILPTYLGCGIAIFKKKTIGYKLAPLLLTFMIIIGLVVIGQNIVQMSMGIGIPIRELFGLVISFIVLGVISFILNIRFLKYVR